MEPQSPPKRITRSRAAKVGDITTTSTKTTRIVTAAAKAKATATTTSTAPPRSTSTKRKTRADDVEEEEHDQQSQQSEPAPRATRPTRGRPRKITEDTAEPVASSSSSSSSVAPGRATRARAAARKVSTTEPAAPKEEPVKPTRGRPRKAATEDVPAKDAEPVKRTARTRAAPVTTSKPAVKKTVTFQEPEKENIAPDASKKTTDKSATATGLRARPVRKPPVPKAPRSIKVAAAAAAAGAASTSKPEKTPLSPKKVTQVPMPRDCSEDELAGPDTPPRPMMKSPTKLPASALASSHKLNLLPVEKSTDTEEHADDDENGAKSETQEDKTTHALASPAKRLPASPYRDSMKSPAKRAEGVSLLKPGCGVNSGGEGVSASPLKASLLQSPAKRPQSAMKPFSLMPTNEGEKKVSNFKASLLQSPAKRPLSPIKGMKPLETSEQIHSPATKPLLLSTPTALRPVKRSSEKLMAEESNAQYDEEDDELDEVAEAMLNESIHLEEPMQFPGRLSAVLPRHADPALKKNMPVFEAAKQQAEQVEQAAESDVFTDATTEDVQGLDAEPMVLDDEPEFQPQSEQSVQAPQLSLDAPSGLFGLRQKDMDPFHSTDSDSDDELANSPRVSAAHNLVPATPTPANSRRSLAQPRHSSIGFTPLAQQLDAWSAASPSKTPRRPVTPGRSLAQAPETLSLAAGTPRLEESPLRSTYFEDEMTVRADMDAQDEIEAAIDAEIAAAADTEDPEFDDLMVTDEDMALAAEANEMSLMEPEELDEIVNTSNSFDDTLSEASQEYGDENEMPVDPALSISDASVPPTTPNRVLAREFHTVTKVPLKGADDSTPRPKKKRAASISRLPVSRPSLNRSATVISYSPSRNQQADEDEAQEHEKKNDENDENEPKSVPVTPAKSDVWSALGTPARTPRRDLNPGLLRGAVVFVDVHTTEGADASGIFVELLTQMGARCVKTWTWNPSATGNSDASKIGITHVVYKDGGKRTMEKVRESNGVVQCVGVSWVLDCERENEWLDEAPYYIDTSLVPRGGARRRKSMEPKALSNQNGMLVPTPVKAGRDAKTAPNTPMNRRDSTVWMHTPSDEADDDDDWQGLISPVPVTPAPETLARYAAETPSTPTDYDSSPTKTLLMQTCPPKQNTFAQMGDGILNRDKDESVMQRLMAARRKSLQFAPKIGSPLAKAWK
ncbi:Putative BRCT domain, microcephalin, BRCT domain superfamily [Colletotrichum destructivum]|uniref:BRCT domain, microcephalin, BRCT domain superfamily n=1 Tax=Colletotrichum destructivum TaxID=34406 RepID=A0AAX4IWP6_9PEZI|nr:Putative BRCT domain, microcephalin, BRCT domain superfamily [Colletotrichum destructivum]